MLVLAVHKRDPSAQVADAPTLRLRLVWRWCRVASGDGPKITPDSLASPVKGPVVTRAQFCSDKGYLQLSQLPPMYVLAAAGGLLRYR
jgi:hypothetical protein